MMRYTMMALAGSALILAGCGDSTPAQTEPGPVTAEDVAAVDRAVTTGVSSDGLPTMSKVMDFETCVRAITSMATEMGVAPINIVETTQVRIVRFNTSDGSVLVTCSAPDRKMLVVQSPHQG